MLAAKDKAKKAARERGDGRETAYKVQGVPLCRASKTHSELKNISADAKNGRASRDYPLIELVLWVYSRLCRSLDRADPEDDAYCLLLSNGADDLATFISGTGSAKEARP